MPKLRIEISEPPEAFDDLSVPLAGEYDEQDLQPHSMVVAGPFDGKARLAGVEVAEVRLKPRFSGHTFNELSDGYVVTNGYIVTVEGQRRPFIGHVYLLR